MNVELLSLSVTLAQAISNIITDSSSVLLICRAKSTNLIIVLHSPTALCRGSLYGPMGRVPKLLTRLEDNNNELPLSVYFAML